MAALFAAVIFGILYAVYKFLPSSQALSGVAPTVPSKGQSPASLSGGAASDTAGPAYLPGTTGLSTEQKIALLGAAISDGAATATAFGSGSQGNTYGPTLSQLGVTPAQQAGIAPLSLGDTTMAEGSNVLVAPDAAPLILDPSTVGLDANIVPDTSGDFSVA